MFKIVFERHATKCRMRLLQSIHLMRHTRGSPPLRRSAAMNMRLRDAAAQGYGGTASETGPSWQDRPCEPHGPPRSVARLAL